MYKFLVVDDEQWIRKWLVKIIPTLRSDIEVVATCDNGEDALKYIENNKVDVIITDIRMPIVDGLQLIKAITEKRLNIKVILISGYDEFEYARSALKLGVVDYLLKPIDKEELNKAIQKTLLQIENKKVSENSQELVHSAIYQILSSYIINGSNGELIKIKSICESNSITYDFIRIAIIQPNIVEQIDNNLEKIIHKKMKDTLINDLKFLILADSLNYVYVILHKGNVRNLDTFFINFKRKMEDIDDKKICNIAFSPWFSEIESFPYYYKEIEENLINPNNINQCGDNNDTDILDDIRNSLIKFISSHDSHSLTDYIENLKEQSFHNEIKIDDFRLMLFNLMSDIIRELSEVNDDLKKDYINEGYNFCIKVYNYSNFNAMLDWVEDYSKRVIAFLSSHAIFDVSQIVKQVYKQMQVDYGKDLNLSTISEKYKINASYFSKKFKEQIGENFVDCLTRIRVKASKLLLLKTDKPIKEIGIEVGFNDPKYFGKVFALNVNMSPSKYRSKVREEL